MVDKKKKVQARSRGRTSNQVILERPTWDSMKKYYPTQSTKELYSEISTELVDLLKTKPRDWQNSCAIRMSYALNRNGFILGRNNGRIVIDGKYNYWINVSDLSQFLMKNFKTNTKDEDVDYTLIKITSVDDIPQTNTFSIDSLFGQRFTSVQTNVLKKISGKKGIIVFEVEGWDDATGHYTLWDGEKLLYADDRNINDGIKSYFWFAQEGKLDPKTKKPKVVQVTRIIFWELR